MTIAEALQEATRRLAEAAERPRLEAEILLADQLGVERSKLLLKDREILVEEGAFWQRIERRLRYEPLEYITARASFYGEEFLVAPGVLIPRPETEILVEKSAEEIGRLGAKRIAEIGVGSGAVSVTLARLFPELQILATDISPRALEIARENCRRLGVEDRVELREGSLLDPVHEAVDLIVSNPPYVPEGTPLEPNVADYEPPAALFAPGDGTVWLRCIVLLGRKRGVPVLCEMGYDQRATMEEFFRAEGVVGYRFYRDLAGLDRGFVVPFGHEPKRTEAPNPVARFTPRSRKD